MNDPFTDLPEEEVRHRGYVLTDRGRAPVLYLSNKLRRTPDSGGARRDWELLKRLTARFDVHYVAFTPGFDEEAAYLDTLALDFASATVVRGGREPGIEGTPARIHDHANPLGRDVIGRLTRARGARLIHVNGYFLMPHVPEALGLPIILQEENIEFELAQAKKKLETGRLADVDTSDFGREIEHAAWRRADHCIAVAREDADSMRAHVKADRVHCLPNGVDTPRPPTRAMSDEDGTLPSRALFVGNYQWAPSRDAAAYIMEELWPQVRAWKPDAEIVLAGAGLDAELRQRARDAPGVAALGPYGGFHDLIGPDTVFVSPLRYGGGNKMKIVEALAAGLPIVATSTSSRGFSDEVRRAIAICDTSDSFALTTALVLEAPTVRANLSRRATRAARSLPRWDSIARHLGDIWTAAIREAPSPCPSLSQSQR